jgi:hypothetical protein
MVLSRQQVSYIVSVGALINMTQQVDCLAMGHCQMCATSRTPELAAERLNFYPNGRYCPSSMVMLL